MKNTKFNLATIVGTRPEIIRLSRVIPTLDKYTNHTLVHTGQNYDYELNEIFFEDLEIRKPDLYLDTPGKNTGETIGNIIQSTYEFFLKTCPDAVLILGDTNSSLAAISAKRNKIPIFHMEAGNRSYDARVPEEINRKIVDHISDINLPYSDIARQYLISEGIKKDHIIKTGSPMDEVLTYYKSKILNSNILNKLSLSSEKYFVFSCHREENIDNHLQLQKLIDLLNYLNSEYELPIIFSTHPRTRKKLEEVGYSFSEKIIFSKPFSFTDYINLQLNAKAVLSDSGTITEESSILNFPALNIRDSHERPEGFEEGSVMFTGLNLKLIKQSLEILLSQPRGKNRLLNRVSDYYSPNLSEKIVRIILSYTKYINEVTWRKH